MKKLLMLLTLFICLPNIALSENVNAEDPALRLTKIEKEKIIAHEQMDWSWVNKAHNCYILEYKDFCDGRDISIDLEDLYSYIINIKPIFSISSEKLVSLSSVTQDLEDLKSIAKKMIVKAEVEKIELEVILQSNKYNNMTIHITKIRLERLVEYLPLLKKVLAEE